MSPTPFTDQALEYVHNMDWMNSGELALCHELYADAIQADTNVEQAAHSMAVAQAKCSRKLYAAALDRKREAFEDGRDALSRIRSIIRNSNARRAQVEQ